MEEVNRTTVRALVVAVLGNAHPPPTESIDTPVVLPPEYLPMIGGGLDGVRWRFDADGTTVEQTTDPALIDRAVEAVIAAYNENLMAKDDTHAHERAATIAVQYGLGEARVTAAASRIFDRWFARGQGDEGKKLGYAEARFPMIAYAKCVKCCIRYGYRPPDGQLAIAAQRLLSWQMVHGGGERVAETLAWLHANQIPGCSYNEIRKDDPLLAEALRSPDPMPVPDDLQRLWRIHARVEAARTAFYADHERARQHQGKIACFIGEEFIGSVPRGDYEAQKRLLMEHITRVRAAHPEFADEPDCDLWFTINVLTDDESDNAALELPYNLRDLSVKP